MVSILFQFFRAQWESKTITQANYLSLNRAKISNLLKITDPFLLVDRAILGTDSNFVEGFLPVNEAMWFYKCHFSDVGIMPGTLQTEVMLQTIVTFVCYRHSIDAKMCLINKASVNFLDAIQGRGLVSVTAEVSNDVNGLVSAKATLCFDKQQKALGSFRFVLPSTFNVDSRVETV